MRRWKLTILTMCLLVICFSFPLSSALAKAKTIELRYSMYFPLAHQQGALADAWAKEVEKRTNGKVKVSVYPGGTLTSPAQIYDGVVKGISDIGYSWFAYTRGRFPLMSVCDLPLGYKSGRAATQLINEFYKKFQPKELNDVKVLYLGGHGPGILHTKDKAVHTLEDAKGLKVRATGSSAPIAKALGMVPVSMPGSEAYDAIKRGVAQGTFLSLEAMEGWRLGEVCKYSIGNYDSAYSTVFFVVMNKAKWNSLPSDIQKTIEEINGEWVLKSAILWDELDVSARKFIDKLGNKFITLSPAEQKRWVKATRPILEKWVKDASAKGLPGQEALAFCLGRLKDIQ